jgi:hypothetical protein
MALNSDTLFSPETLKIVHRAFNECLDAAESLQPQDGKARATFQVRVAQAILRAVAQGERDPERLKAIGLESVRQLSGADPDRQ